MPVTTLLLSTREDIESHLLRGLAEGQTNRSGFDYLRAEVEIQDVDPLVWLQGQVPGARGYWSDRGGSFVLAGVGRADMVSSSDFGSSCEVLNELHDRLDRAPVGVRYFGGLAFDTLGRDVERWKTFQPSRFILPRFEVCRRDARTVFACNMRKDEELEQVCQEFSDVSFDVPNTVSKLPAVLTRSNVPEEAGWSAAVERVLAEIRSGACEKVVLARVVELTCDEAVNPIELLAALHVQPGQRYRFCFQPSPDAALIGASPEGLYRREGSVVESEAMAGTRRRSTDPVEDDMLRDELLASDKERREQAFVSEAIRSGLSELCDELVCESEPRVRRISTTQHLVSSFRAVLKEGLTDADLLPRLHPTPAVGGSPEDAALRLIDDLEPFPRGWFAGAVGWLSRDAAQFAVGIRSALVKGKEVYLFSGAGIIEGSVPRDEWDELEAKICDYLSILERP